MKAAVTCLAYPHIVAVARVHCDPKYKSYSKGYGLNNLLKIRWKLPVFLYLIAEALNYFGSFMCTFRTTKLLYLTV
jgi:hypothetical protein